MIPDRNGKLTSPRRILHEVLVKEIVARKGTIQDPISASLTRAMKLTAWSNIAEAVSVVSGIRCLMEEIRTMLTNLKSVVKKNYHRQGAMEKLLLDFIGEEALNGIEGGLETLSGFSQTKQSSNSSSE